MVYVVPLICFVLPLIAAHVALRRRLGWTVALWTVVCALGMVWAIWRGRQEQGWDGIGYAILLMLVLAPAVLGAWVGAALGYWRRRRQG